MDDDAIRAQIEQSTALVAETEALLAKQSQVMAEVREVMAEQLGCSQWDLEQAMNPDSLTAEDREKNEAEALNLIRQQIPEFDTFNDAQPARSAPPPSSPFGAGLFPTGEAPTGVRPRRRMI